MFFPLPAGALVIGGSRSIGTAIARHLAAGGDPFSQIVGFGIAVGRYGQLREITSAIAFLASPDAAFNRCGHRRGWAALTLDSSPFTRSIAMNTIGIIGAGAIGSAFAKALAGKGLEAIIANSRGPDSLADLARELGPSITPGTREQAAAQDIVLVAVNWSKLPAALAGLPDFGGRIVIDANNPIEAPLFEPAELHGRTSSEAFADLVPGARVVKAFNHLPAHLISDDPQAEGGRRVLFFAGDDAHAKSAVSGLIERLGFFGIDLGSLEGGGRLVQIPGGPLPVLNLVKLG